MDRKNPSKRRPAPHPDDFPLGSPESRAAARTLAEAQANATEPIADRTIRILSHLPGLPGQTASFVHPDGKTVAVIIEPAPRLDAPAPAPEESAGPQPIEKHPQNRPKGEKP